MAETFIKVETKATNSDRANFLALVEQLIGNFKQFHPDITDEQYCLLLDIAKPKAKED